MNYEACIFDLDGVIVQTAHLHFQAWTKIAHDLNIDFSLEQNEELKGVDRMTSLNKILSWSDVDLSESQKKELCFQKNELYKDYIQHIDQEDSLPGVLPLLCELKKQGTKLAVGSASKNAVTILTQLGIIDLFDDIIDGTKVVRSKPDPETFLLASTSLNVQPDRSVVFEDAVAGIQAAKSGGFMTIGVGDKDHLHQADAVISSFENFDVDSLESILNEMQRLN